MFSFLSLIGASGPGDFGFLGTKSTGKSARDGLLPGFSKPP
jgi:hypothetical protein